MTLQLQAYRRLEVAVLMICLLSACQSESHVIEIMPLADGVWMHTSYHTYPSGKRFPANGLIVQSDDGLLLVDTAWGEHQTGELLDVIEAQLGMAVSSAIITHAHDDRVSGTDLLEQRGVIVVAHPLTRKLAAAAGLAIPNRALTGLEQSGGSTNFAGVEVYYPGHGHSEDNLVVWLPTQRVLFGGCAVRALDSSSAGNVADADLPSWSKVINDLLARYPDTTTVVPGHGDPGGIELLTHSGQVLAAERQSQ